MAVVFSDDFNRSDSATLGGNWVELDGNQNIVSNKIKGIASGVAYNTTAIGSANHSVSVDFDPGQGGGDEWVFVLARMNTSTLYADCYFMYFQANSGGDDFQGIYKKVSGGQTALGSLHYSSGTAEVNVKLTCNGTSIKGYLDDSQILSFTDSAQNNDGYHGVRLDTDSSADNYVVDDLTIATTTSTTTSTSTSTSSTSTSTSTTTSTTTSTSTITSTTTTINSNIGCLAFGVETPTNGETPIEWSTWDGTGAITGDSNWGKLQVDNGEYEYSQVYSFGDETERTITITENVYGTGQGSATIQIRGQATTFNEADGSPSWEDYTIPTLKTWKYIQMRVTK